MAVEKGNKNAKEILFRTARASFQRKSWMFSASRLAGLAGFSVKKYLPDYATQRVLRWLLEGGRFDRVFLAKKAVQDYVFTDGTADKSIERKFAEDLDAADEVCVYAKLPRAFQIPTPVGNYSPDWAIAFYEGTVKHIFFVAETKGSMESLELRPIEQAKIACAKKLFRGISTNKVVYHEVDSYSNLLDITKSI